MPKQTKKTATETQSIVAHAVPAVPATPVESSSSSEPVKKQRMSKAKQIAAAAAAQHILLHAKRPSTDYLYFCEEVRPKIMSENPTFNFTQVGQEQGRRWKALPVEVKALYKARWEADKKRYEEEKALVDKARLDNPEIFKQLEAHKKKSARRAKKRSSVKRARSAFIIYCQEQRPLLKQSSPNMSFTDMGRSLGQQWKAMTDEQKVKYEEEAKRDNERYHNEKEAEKESSSGAEVEAVAEEKKARKPRAAKVAEPSQEKKPRKPRAIKAADAAAPTPAPAAATEAVTEKKPRKPRATKAADAVVPAAAPAAAQAAVPASSTEAAEPKKRGRKPKAVETAAN